MGSQLTKIITFAVVLYGVICLFYFLNQSRFVFLGAATDPMYEKKWQDLRFDIDVEDVMLEGWHVRNTPAPAASMIYFGGNAENVIYNVPQFKQLGVSDVFLFNYRGYGNSQGQASEEKLYQDALKIYDRVQTEKPQQPILIVGRSLGSGVASYLAKERGHQAVILITPYDALWRVGQYHFPWLPVDYLAQIRFEAAELAKAIKTPLLAILASEDVIIPASRSEALVKAWGGTAQSVTLNADHNSISYHPAYLQTLNHFISEIMRR